MKIIVCGGAGYIGSHLVKELSKLDHTIIVFDNLSKGHIEAVPATAKLEIGDIRNPQDLDRVFGEYKPEACFHFSASIEVAESVADPLKYYENNVGGTITLLKVLEIWLGDAETRL